MLGWLISLICILASVSTGDMTILLAASVFACAGAITNMKEG